MELLPDMGYPEYKQVSEPLVIEDVNNKMQAIRLFMDDPRVSVAGIITAINDTTGLHFKLVPAADRSALSGGDMTLNVSGEVVPAPSDKQKEVKTTARDATPNRQNESGRTGPSAALKNDAAGPGCCGFEA